MSKRTLLWMGDAAVASGFARCTHNTLKEFVDTWDVHVLGLNYTGDPHEQPFKIYPAWSGGDAFGLNRVAGLINKIQPDAIIVQNDPWNIPAYLKKIGDEIPVIAVMPVDGKNCQGSKLNSLKLAIFWTDFAIDEARKGGYTGKAAVVPLGVDLNIYMPTDRKVARANVGLPEGLEDVFIVGNINRNQPRKRLDLSIRYFCEWLKNYDIQDAYLFLHICPTGDQGFDVSQLMSYYGLANRLIIAEPDIGQGVPEHLVVETYNAFNIQISTTQGEGWGLTQMEGMACGIPQIAPNWAALGDWAKDAAYLVPCTETAVTPNFVNILGGVPDRLLFIEALDLFYREETLRKSYTEKGFDLVKRSEFNWKNIGTKFRNVVEEALFSNVMIHPARGTFPVDGINSAIDKLNSKLGISDGV